jgi:hypothetical protein
MKRILLLAAALLLALPLSAISSKSVLKAFRNPEDAYRPYVRWWWNGDKVDEAEIRREMNLLKEAGIAGVEINPISFPNRKEDGLGKKSLIWLSDEWIDMDLGSPREVRALQLNDYDHKTVHHNRANDIYY